MSPTQLNESVVLELDGDEPRIACAHCAHELARGTYDYRSALAVYEGPNTEAGPQLWPQPADYVDTPIVFRQYYCPSCYVALATEVVPHDHPALVDEVVGAAKTGA